jgi:DNA-binding winged helix-turn-helix (wHTH) protein/dipeptidyl aminopeptidase/acylaminoacyl peptidase
MTLKDSPRLIRFGTFEVDLVAGELRKGGVKLRLTGQPFQVLAILLERPGEVVTREELQKRLWPDTFVDVDHNLNTAINKIREVLGDSADSPRFVETLPRRGYRFIGPIEREQLQVLPRDSGSVPAALPFWRRSTSIGFVLLVILAAAGAFIYWRTHAASLAPPKQRTLTRLTFDDGLQFGATWSPDSRFIAYSSDRGGKFDIWVQQVSGGDPVQVTRGPGHKWQPDWSPDGKYIAYRSEEGDGGLFVIPALGGEGLARKIAVTGYSPRWSPDSSQVLFQTSQLAGLSRFYVIGLDGSAPREVLGELTTNGEANGISAAWHPDGTRITAWVREASFNAAPSFWTGPVTGGAVTKSEIAPEIAKQITEIAADLGSAGWAEDFKFTWAPSGKAIYFERTFRGATNIWRMTINARTLQVTGIDRVTTGAELDTGLALSANGDKVAFTNKSHQIRAWVMPFDATQGRVTGSAQPVSTSGIEAWMHDLSRDGKELAFLWQPRGQVGAAGEIAIGWAGSPGDL